MNIVNIDRASGNDLTLEFAIRYRLASDPDVDASYTAVTTTKLVLGITMPYFDVEAMADGEYVVHSYYIPDGNTTGTKITVVIGEVVLP